MNTQAFRITYWCNPGVNVPPFQGQPESLTKLIHAASGLPVSVTEVANAGEIEDSDALLIHPGNHWADVVRYLGNAQINRKATIIFSRNHVDAIDQQINDSSEGKWGYVPNLPADIGELAGALAPYLAALLETDIPTYLGAFDKQAQLNTIFRARMPEGVWPLDRLRKLQADYARCIVDGNTQPAKTWKNFLSEQPQ